MRRYAYSQAFRGRHPRCRARAGQSATEPNNRPDKGKRGLGLSLARWTCLTQSRKRRLGQLRQASRPPGSHPDHCRHQPTLRAIQIGLWRVQRLLSHQLTAFFTSATILASSAAVNSVRAKAVGHMAPSSRFAESSKPKVAYRDLNFSAVWKKQRTLPSLA